MPKLHVHTKFTLRHDDGTTTDFALGEHEFDDTLANHWYVKLHARDPNAVPAAPPSRDDSKALDAIEDDLIAKERSLSEWEVKLKALASEFDKRAEALTAREGDLATRIEAFEAEQRAAAEQSSEKAAGSQSKQTGKKS